MPPNNIVRPRSILDSMKRFAAMNQQRNQVRASDDYESWVRDALESGLYYLDPETGQLRRKKRPGEEGGDDED